MDPWPDPPGQEAEPVVTPVPVLDLSQEIPGTPELGTPVQDDLPPLETAYESYRCVDLLQGNLSGLWQVLNRKRPVWAFFVPSDDERYAGQTLGKKASEQLVCLVCHAGETGTLQSNYPRQGKFAASDEDENVSTWLPECEHGKPVMANRPCKYYADV
jgi:hypothetical protein